MIDKAGKSPKPEPRPSEWVGVPTSQGEGGTTGVGARLEQARKELDLKQEEFAAAMGISLGTYHRYRRDEGTPRVPELARIAGLGVDMNWMITGSGTVMRQHSGAASGSEELQPHMPVLPNAARFAIDEQLIVEAVTAIETWLDERNLTLPAETKGKVVALLVEDAMAYRDEERAARIRSQTGLMLRLVA